MVKEHTTRQAEISPAVQELSVVTQCPSFKRVAVRSLLKGQLLLRESNG